MSKVEVDQTDMDALIQATEALISVNGRACSSIGQLANYTTRTSRFLFPKYRYAEGGYKQSLALEARAFLVLVNKYAGVS